MDTRGWRSLWNEDVDDLFFGVGGHDFRTAQDVLRVVNVLNNTGAFPSFFEQEIEASVPTRDLWLGSSDASCDGLDALVDTLERELALGELIRAVPVELTADRPHAEITRNDETLDDWLATDSLDDLLDEIARHVSMGSKYSAGP
jgi:hypothetical protein